MKRNIKPLIAFLLTISLASKGIAQDNGFYYPDGKPYKRECKNINDINSDFDAHGRVMIHIASCQISEDCLTSVGFKLFTNEPLWVMTTNPKTIESAIKEFDYQEYLNGWQFEHDLSRFIEKKVLSDIFILETLGPPSDRTKYFDASGTIEQWEYESLNISLRIKDGIVYSFVR